MKGLQVLVLVLARFAVADLGTECRASTAEVVRNVHVAIYEAASGRKFASPVLSRAIFSTQHWLTHCSEAVEAVQQIAAAGLPMLEAGDLYGCVADAYALVKTLAALGSHLTAWEEGVLVEDLYTLMEVLGRLVKECQ